MADGQAAGSADRPRTMLARLTGGFADLPRPSPHAAGFAAVLATLMGLLLWAASPDTRLEQAAAANHWAAADGPPDMRQVSYTQGIGLLKGKQVTSLTVHVGDNAPTRAIDLELSNGARRWFRSTLGPNLEEAISASGADVSMADDGVTLGDVAQAAGLAMSLVALCVFGLILVNMARKFFTSPARLVLPGRNAARFGDVAGQPEAVAAMREIIAVMREPERFAEMGARLSAGVLMVGEPGNGKTLLARAMAAEAGVPFMAASGSDFLEMFAGLGARRVRAMMTTARRQARRHGACILFIDEAEVVAGTRGLGNGGDVASERDQTVVAMLSEFDGMQGRKGVVLLLATNRPELLDPAITRPGRIDRRIDVARPDAAARAAILGVHCRGLRLAADVEPDAIGRSMAGSSGADLANLANMAALAAARRRLPAIDRDCFEEARDELLMGEARTAAEPHPAEVRTAAAHEAGHALLAVLQDECDPVYKATVVQRKANLGQVVTVATRDWKTMSRAKLTAILTVLVAGRAAEEATEGPDAVTTGAGADIRQATLVLREAIGRHGMHRGLGMVDHLGDGPTPAASPATMERLDAAVESVIAACHANALATIRRHAAGHAALAEALFNAGTLHGDEIRAIVHRHAPSDTQRVRSIDPWEWPRSEAA